MEIDEIRAFDGKIGESLKDEFCGLFWNTEKVEEWIDVCCDEASGTDLDRKAEDLPTSFFFYLGFQESISIFFLQMSFVHLFLASCGQFDQYTKFECGVEKENIRSLRCWENLDGEDVLLVGSVCLVKEEFESIREPIVINQVLDPRGNCDHNRVVSPCISALVKTKFAPSKHMLSGLKVG